MPRISTLPASGYFVVTAVKKGAFSRAMEIVRADLNGFAVADRSGEMVTFSPLSNKSAKIAAWPAMIRR